jgi:Flp pilus assembly pilin Flp
MLPKHFRRDEGQTMAEYAVILTIITAAIVAALTLLSDNVRMVFERTAGFFLQF